MYMYIYAEQDSFYRKLAPGRGYTHTHTYYIRTTFHTTFLRACMSEFLLIFENTTCGGYHSVVPRRVCMPVTCTHAHVYVFEKNVLMCPRERYSTNFMSFLYRTCKEVPGNLNSLTPTRVQEFLYAVRFG